MPIHLLQIAKKLAHDAGKMALKYQEKGFKTEWKGSHVNLVTDADKACEELIIKTIKRNFPDHGILSEERKELEGSGEFKWIIDPIDGTSNFAHGMPIFAVSIAIVHKGKPIIGVVEIPALKESFWAKQGLGAHIGDRRIQVSKVGAIQDSLLATGFPYKRDARYQKNIELFDAFYKPSHGIRRMGSASIDLCFVACGRFDGFWEYDLEAWDIAAGKIIVEEAGGVVTNMDGSTLNPKLKNILASNGLVHTEMIELIKAHGGDKV